MASLKYGSLLLLYLIPLTCQSRHGNVLSSPRQLVVRTEPSRGAIVVSRMVRPPRTTTTGSMSTTSTTTVEPDANATTTTRAPSTPTATPAASPSPSDQNHLMTGVIELAFAGLRELDINTTQVSNMAHTFFKFNEIQLGALPTLTDIRRETTLPQTNGVQGSCQEARANMQTAGSDQPNATVVVKMCAIESNGTAMRDGEAMPLTEGQLMLMVGSSGWHWCGCNDEEGHYLEFNLTVMVPEGRSISTDENSDMPLKIKLGSDDSFMMISTKYGSLSTWKSMPEGYPMLMQMDSASNRVNVTVRVPRDYMSSDYLLTLVVEPGYLSADSPIGPVGSAPRVIEMNVLTIATGVFFMLAALFSHY